MSYLHMSKVAVLCLALGACSYPLRNYALDDTAHQSADQDHSYYYQRIPRKSAALDGTLVIVTMSGGGVRATALAASVLTGLSKVNTGPDDSLADNIDLVSSVSGGSVTAAQFALFGKAGLQPLETNFIDKDGIGALLVDGANPVGLVALSSPSKERIDLFINYLDRQLFDKKTFQTLINQRQRPFLILNAADMVEGVPFSLTQETMNLLCSDLSSLKVSTAVAASAAFPVLLSPVTLKNYSPCALTPALREQHADDAGTRFADDPGRLMSGRIAMSYLDGTQKQFIHLLDGGIADNLGLAAPFKLLTDASPRPGIFGRQPTFFQDIAAGRINKIVFIMINARSFATSKLDRQQATPGMIDMLMASINGSIDQNSFGTTERLRNLLDNEYGGQALYYSTLEKAARDAGDSMQAESYHALAQHFQAVNDHTYFIDVDFDAITDDRCRTAFHQISTTWTLPKPQLAATLKIGEALLASDPRFDAMLAAIGGTLPQDQRLSVDEVCSELLAATP